MDIVGSRVVTVEARTRYLGDPLTATTRIAFGNGPLSVFTKGPSGFLPWAKACGDKHIIVCHNEKNEYDKNNR